MSKKPKPILERWSDEYAGLLEASLEGASSRVLERAAALGRQLVVGGVAPHEVAVTHTEILARLCEQRGAEGGTILRGAEAPLVELLKAYSAPHEGQRASRRRSIEQPPERRNAAGPVADVEAGRQESERELRLIADHLEGQVAYVGSDRRYRFVNKQYEAWHGIECERIVGKHIRELLGEANYKTVERYVDAVLSGRQVSFDASVMYLNHRTRRVRVTYIPDKDLDGSTVGFCALINDVTEYKLAQELLHVKDRALASSINAVAIADLDGKLIYVNDAFLRLWGYDHEQEVLGTPAVAHWQSETKAAAVISALRDQGGELDELVTKRKDGSFFDAQVAASLVRDEAGRPICMLASFLDVTERKRTEQALRESEQKLAGIVSSVTDHMSMIDANHTIVWANSVAERPFGSDLVGKKCYAAYHRRRRPCGRCLATKTFDDGQVHEHETEVITTGGEKRVFWCTASVAARHPDGRPRLVVETSRDITERRQAAEDLHRSEESAWALLNASIDAGLLLDAEGRILALNETAARSMGGTPGELIGQRPFDHYPPEVARVREQATMEVIRSGQPLSFEDERDGRLFETHVQPVLDPSGRVARVAVFGRDITERKRAEAAIKDSEQRLRELAENIGDVFWLCDTHDAGRVVYASPAYEAIWGRSLQDLYENPQDWLEAVHPDDRPSVSAAGHEQRQGQRSAQEYRIVRPDGSIRWIRERTFPVRDQAGATYRLAGVATDVTERRQVEEALRKSEQKIRAILDHSSEFIGLLTLDGIVTAANKTALDFAGITESDALGKPFWETHWWAHSAELRSRLRDAVRRAAAGEFVRFEATHPAKDGSIHHVDFSLKPVKDEAGNVSLLIPEGRDITDRKQAEAALKESEETIRALLNATRDVVLLIDRDGTVLAANEALAQRLGRRVNKLMGRCIYDFLADDVALIRKTKAQEALTTGRPVHYLDERAGRYLDSAVHPLVDAEGRVDRLAVFARDVTEQRRTEAALAESRERYRALFEQAPDSIVLVDAESGAPVEFNDQTCENLGYTRAEFQNLTVADLEAIESHEQVLEHVAKIIGEGSDAFETRHRTKTGEIRDVVVISRGVSIGGRNFSLSIWRDVTERKRMEDDLRKFKIISDQASYGAAISDLDGNLTYVNNVFAEMHGYTAAELVGQHLSLFHAKEQLPRVTALLEMLKREGRFNAEEVWHQRVDGSVFPTLMNATVIEDEAGAPAYLSATAIDVTERKRAEQALRESESRYRQLFATVSDAVVVFDAETLEFVDINDAASRLYAYTSEEFLKLRLSDISAEPEESVASIRQTLAGQLTRIPLRCHKRKDGTIFPVEISASTLVLGKRRLLCGVIRDISERRHAEEALRRQALAFENMFDAVIMAGPRNRIIDWNPAASRIYGYARDEILGKTPEILYGPGERADLSVTIAEALERDGHWSGTSRCVRKDGRGVDCEATIVALRDEEQELVGSIHVARDITEQLRAEEEAHRRQTELAHVTRLATMGEMATGLAHQLNQPLSAILYYARGCGRRLQAGTCEADEILGVMEKVASQAERAGAFVDRIRAFVRKTEPRLAPVDLNQAIREAVAFAEHETRENGVTVDFQLAGLLPRVAADMIQIEQVILNVVRNGIEAMQETEPERRRLTIRTFSANRDAIACAIDDTGGGCSEEVAGQLFDAFFTTKPGGMGMGLAISRSIVEAHGGRLWAEPNPDGGMSFRFSLPIARTGAHA